MNFLKEYVKTKYLVCGAVNTILAIVLVLVIDYVYPAINFNVDVVVSLSLGTIISFAILGYAIGYFHERIPHCTSKMYESMARYTGMILLFTAPLVYLILLPQTLYDWFYFADFLFSIAGIPAIVTVYIMYKFAKKGEKPTATCSV